MQRGRLKILILNQYFPPDESATASVFDELVALLADAGHLVTIRCGRPSYNTTKRLPWRPVRSRSHGPATVQILGSTAFDRASGLGRRLNYMTFLFLAALFSRRGSWDVVIVGTDPPLAVVPALITAPKGGLLYHLQDLHPAAALAAGLIRPGRVVRYWESLHTWAMKRADRVVCLGSDMAVRIAEKGVSPAKVSVVPNGAHPAEGSVDCEVVRRIRNGSDFLAVHAGNLGSAGAWETLIGAQGALGNEARIVFVGGGSAADSLRAAGVSLLPFVPKEEFPSVMAAGDLQIVTMTPGMEGVIVPSKTYSILAHGRPLLAVVPTGSEVAHLVETYRCGLVADPRDPQDVVAKIRWAKQHPDALDEMARAAAVASERFKRSECLGEVVAIAEQMAADRSKTHND